VAFVSPPTYAGGKRRSALFPFSSCALDGVEGFAVPRRLRGCASSPSFFRSTNARTLPFFLSFAWALNVWLFFQVAREPLSFFFTARVRPGDLLATMEDQLLNGNGLSCLYKAFLEDVPSLRLRDRDGLRSPLSQRTVELEKERPAFSCSRTPF